MNIIAADVGGTKTHMVCADADAPQHVLYQARYRSGEFNSFEPLLETFMRESGSSSDSVDTLALALPGLVEDSRATLTNLPWIIEKQHLIDTFGIKHIEFMNDFQASACGTSQLKQDDVIILNPGIAQQPPQGVNLTRVAVGAGTGLGVAWAQGEAGNAQAHDTEGGHIDFAPTSDIQVDLLCYLMNRHEHVSFERILSGDGLVTLYEFMLEKHGERSTNATAGKRVTAEWVSNNAHYVKAAGKAVSLFVEIYGAYVGNIAMLFKPRGGIYITGGIAAKMVDAMCSDTFLNAYLNKGRMRALVEQITVNLVINEDIGVLGALYQAAKHQQVSE